MSRIVSRLSLGAAALALAVGLAGCGGDAGAPETPDPVPTETKSAQPGPSATPVETEAPQATVTLPTDCLALGTPATRAETVDQLTLQSDGEGFVRPAPEGAQLALGCDWIAGDTTGMLLLISTAEPPAVEAALGAVPGQGYTCQPAEDFGAQFCTLPGSGPDTEEMIVARENVWIYMSTSNLNGRALLSEIVQGIFG